MGKSARRASTLLVVAAALATAHAAGAAGGAPTNSAPPQLTGAPTKGETLTLAAGAWGGKHLEFTYAWQRCDAQGGSCAPIVGMTTVTLQRSDSYTLGEADVGERLRVLVTARNADGSATASSDLTPPVAERGPRYSIGRIDRYTFFSPAVNHAQEVYVYLPPGYSPRSPRRYPVLYLLHGYPGDPTSYIGGVPAGSTEDALLARRALSPLILVMPSGKPDPPADTAWVDGAGANSAWETYLARDTVRWAESCFNIDPSPAARGIAGLSDGGYGALNIALHHPSEFRLVESWSGYTHADATLTAVYGGDGTRLAYNSPALYLPSAAGALRRAGVRFWLYIGDQDGGLPENAQFAARLRAARILNTFLVFPGSHLPSFYRERLPLALQVASRMLTASQRKAVSSTRPARPSSCTPLPS